MFDSMDINFNVVKVDAYDSLKSHQGNLLNQGELVLTLRAEKDSKISLINGESIAHIDIYISLKTPYKTSSELAPELTNESIGFLIQTFSPNEGYFIHGSVLWGEKQLPLHLLHFDGEKKCSITVSNVKPIFENELSYKWKTGRENILHLNSITFRHSV